MNISGRIQAVALCVLTMVAIVLYNTRKPKWKKPIWGQYNELMCERKTDAGLIQVQLLPPAIFWPGDGNSGSRYVLRIKLKAKQPIRQQLMQYMNFGIDRYFLAIQGDDTLQQMACEKVPGIDRNEFVYITCFDKPPISSDINLLICIADTAAGFGNNRFEFKNKTLQKLQQ